MNVVGLIFCIASFLIRLACAGFVSGFACADVVEQELDRRYAPYAIWSFELDFDDFAQPLEGPRWWKSPEVIRANGDSVSPSLAGLHLAIDPGHIGGTYAWNEGRNFRISESDYFVREGELTLEVSKLLRERLEPMGVKISLLRESQGNFI